MTVSSGWRTLVLGCALCAGAAAEASAKTMSFVIRDWFTAVYDTKFGDECPAGLNISNDEYWWRGLSKSDRGRLTEDGLLSTLSRFGTAVRRGPNGEDVCLNPTVVKDPPFLTVEGKTSFGTDLDGNSDGAATAKTCAHANFVGPNGEPGIDNQMYRLLGCTYGWRTNGLVDLNANEMRGTSGLGMILIEIDGVDDARNDDDVTVSYYRSIDQFTMDSNGKPTPYMSYRIDMADGKPRYGDKLKGSIKDGVVKTATGDVRLPFYGNYNSMHPVIRDMSMHLEIEPSGASATGYIYGYYDVNQFLHWVLGTGANIAVSNYSCPGLYVAAHEMADGYPDPATGKCTHISSAFEIRAYAAFVVHPTEGEREIADR